MSRFTLSTFIFSSNSDPTPTNKIILSAHSNKGNMSLATAYFSRTTCIPVMYTGPDIKLIYCLVFDKRIRIKNTIYFPHLFINY